MDANTAAAAAPARGPAARLPAKKTPMQASSPADQESSVAARSPLPDQTRACSVRIRWGAPESGAFSVKPRLPARAYSFARAITPAAARPSESGAHAPKKAVTSAVPARHRSSASNHGIPAGRASLSPAPSAPASSAPAFAAADRRRAGRV